MSAAIEARTTCISPGQREERNNREVPQREQNPRCASAEDAYQVSVLAWSNSKRLSSMPTQVTSAAP